MPAVHALAGRVQQPPRRARLPPGDGAGRAGRPGSQGQRPRQRALDPGRHPRPHDLPGDTPARDPRRLRTDAGERPRADLHGRPGRALADLDGRQPDGARPGRAPRALGLHRQRPGAARAGLEREAFGLARLRRPDGPPLGKGCDASRAERAVDGRAREGPGRRADGDAGGPRLGLPHRPGPRGPARRAHHAAQGRMAPAGDADLGAGHAHRPERRRGRARAAGLGQRPRHRAAARGRRAEPGAGRSLGHHRRRRPGARGAAGPGGPGSLARGAARPGLGPAAAQRQLVERQLGLAGRPAAGPPALVRGRRPRALPPGREGQRQGLAAAPAVRSAGRRGPVRASAVRDRLDAARLAQQRGRQGPRGAQRAGRLRPQGRPARHHEPGRGAADARERRRHGLRQPHPPVPGAGVPPAGVRGQGRAQRGTARRRPALLGHAERDLLRRRGPAGTPR